MPTSPTGSSTRSSSTEPAAALFELRGVTQRRDAATPLRDVTLAVPRGEVTALVGPSGAGKTSLLRLLNRLDDPAAGTIAFDGRPIGAIAVGALRRQVGFVFQTPTMFPGTVADNLRIAAAIRPDAGTTPSPDVTTLLASVELAPDYATRTAARLSGGEQQRVALARALVTAPHALLLDEPTAALDPEVADRLMHTVARLAREHGLTVVMATHRLGEARLASTHLVMLAEGAVVETGATDALFRGAAQARTRAYLASGT